MIDVHTHILPGLDDGAADLAESIRMAAIAADDGIATLVATPHAEETFGLRRGLAARRLEQVREALGEAGIALEVLPGCEAFLDPEVGGRAAAGALPTLNVSRYLLVEWPLASYPPFVPRALAELIEGGLAPVLAHGERYRAVQDDVNLLVSLIAQGMLVQVTAGSLLGEFGPTARRTAEIMLEHGMAHLLASDAHSSAWRPPRLARGVARAAQIVGEDAARRLVADVPAAIVANQPIEVPAARPLLRRPHWASWR